MMLNLIKLTSALLVAAVVKLLLALTLIHFWKKYQAQKIAVKVNKSRAMRQVFDSSSKYLN